MNEARRLPPVPMEPEDDLILDTPFPWTDPALLAKLAKSRR